MMTLSHGFSGFVCGRVAMPLLRRHAAISERAMGWGFFLGALMPDMDIVSKVMGRAAYFSDNWYAHRGASHSLLGTMVLAAIGAALLLRPAAGFWPHESIKATKAAKAYLWLAGCFWAGGMIHIFGDLFTPGLSMPVFWPLAAEYGSLSHIGWFSPYLLWLFLATLLIARVLWKGAEWVPRVARWREAALWLVFATAAGRWVQFLIQSRYDSHQQWAEFHRTLLPESMISGVTRGVSYLWFWLAG